MYILLMHYVHFWSNELTTRNKTIIIILHNFSINISTENDKPNLIYYSVYMVHTFMYFQR